MAARKKPGPVPKPERRRRNFSVPLSEGEREAVARAAAAAGEAPASWCRDALVGAALGAMPAKRTSLRALREELRGR